jgi:hypothetical protein
LHPPPSFQPDINGRSNKPDLLLKSIHLISLSIVAIVALTNQSHQANIASSDQHHTPITVGHYQHQQPPHLFSSIPELVSLGLSSKPKINQQPARWLSSTSVSDKTLQNNTPHKYITK